MKKLLIILIILLAIMIIACTCSCGKSSTLYPETGKVVEICNDEVVVETCTGNLFVFYGAEDWFVDDTVSMIMDSCGTANVKDDVIITVKYSGVWKK